MNSDQWAKWSTRFRATKRSRELIYQDAERAVRQQGGDTETDPELLIMKRVLISIDKYITDIEAAGEISILRSHTAHCCSAAAGQFCAHARASAASHSNMAQMFSTLALQVAPCIATRNCGRFG